MNKSLAPLIVFMSFIVLVTIVLINFRAQPKQNGEAPYHAVPLLGLKKLSVERKPAAIPAQSQENNQKQQENIQPDTEKIMKEVLLNLNSNDEKAAEDKLRTILLFEPENINALNLLGNILYASKRYEEAEAIFRKQEKIRPEDATVYNNLGSILARQKKYDEAISATLKALELEPESPVSNINMAGIYAASGDIERGLYYFRKAYEKLGEKIIPLSYDPALDSIRYEYEFQNIIDEARNKLNRQKDSRNHIDKTPQPPPGLRLENEQNQSTP